MKRFEYRVLELKGDSIWDTVVKNETVVSTLNELGAEGWEVIDGFGSAMSQAMQRQTILLKREMPAE
jgi:hypothetical protein